MATELAPVECRSGQVSLTRYWGPFEKPELQLTFREPENNRYVYMQLTTQEAQNLAFALIQFITGTRDELE